MSFFGIGPTEMVVIAVVALMLFNPRELPKMLRSIAKFWGQLRATADEFKDTIMTADGVDEIQELVKGTKGQIRQVENDARRELMKARAEMRKAQQKLLKANQAKLQQQQQALDETEDAGVPRDDEDAADGPVAATPPEAADAPGATEAPVAATAPHHQRPNTDDAEPSATPSGDTKDGHNQGAA